MISVVVHPSWTKFCNRHYSYNMTLELTNWCWYQYSKIKKTIIEIPWMVSYAFMLGSNITGKSIIWDISLQWCHNGHDGVSNHQLHDCLLKRLFKTSKLRVTGFCVGNSSVTGQFPAQMTNNAQNVSISWRHHVYIEIDLSTLLPKVIHSF